MSSDKSKEKKLHAVIGGGGGWYRAHCPEIDVFGQGETPSSALDSLMVAVLMTSKYIVGQDFTEDPRHPFATMVWAGGNREEVSKSLFQIDTSDTLTEEERQEAHRWLAM